MYSVDDYYFYFFCKLYYYMMMKRPGEQINLRSLLFLFFKYLLII